ncbi:hypothetical protein RB600_003281 [Gaeumannomyces tritici]
MQAEPVPCRDVSTGKRNSGKGRIMFYKGGGRFQWDSVFLSLIRITASSSQFPLLSQSFSLILVHTTVPRTCVPQQTHLCFYPFAALAAAFAATNVLGHGVVTDTSIIRDRELGTGRASALARTQGGGPVDAATMVQLFMDNAGANTTEIEARQLFGLGGGGGGAGAGKASAGVATPKNTKETAVLAATGMGAAAQGPPTTSDDGSIKVVFHQVNQDGAGPLTADIGATSGGTEASAFQKAEISQNVPGLGIAGLSGAQTMDFPVEVKMPAGMTCQGQVDGASNVCIARLRSAAVTGPFGGSVVFTRSPAAKKRAIEYNLRKRMLSRRFAAAAA